MKAEAGRGLGLEPELEETLGSGDTGRVLRKELLVPSMMPMALLELPFRAGVRGGESGPLTCNDPVGL